MASAKKKRQVRRMMERDLKEAFKKAPKYIPRIIPIKAIQFSSDVEIAMDSGKLVKAKQGDYAVLDRNGKILILSKESFETEYEDFDFIARHLIKMSDEHNSILNMMLIARTFVQLFDNPKKKVLTIIISLPGGLQKIKLYYRDEETMIEEKQFLEVILRKYRRRLIEAHREREGKDAPLPAIPEESKKVEE